MYNLLENLFISKELYQTLLAPVCNKYGITQAEISVLLFLANYPKKDTATDIAEIRKMTKSSVSMAVRGLQERGLVTGEYINGNHRSVHLKLSEKAVNIINEGQFAQNEFYKVLVENFSDSEKADFKNFILMVSNNIKNYNGKLIKK